MYYYTMLQNYSYQNHLLVTRLLRQVDNLLHTLLLFPLQSLDYYNKIESAKPVCIADFTNYFTNDNLQTTGQSIFVKRHLWSNNPINEEDNYLNLNNWDYGPFSLNINDNLNRNCIPNQNWAFVCYLKIINTYLENNVSML